MNYCSKIIETKTKFAWGWDANRFNYKAAIQKFYRDDGTCGDGFITVWIGQHFLQKYAQVLILLYVNCALKINDKI